MTAMRKILPSLSRNRKNDVEMWQQYLPKWKRHPPASPVKFKSETIGIIMQI
jgi:hypothetical protein